MAEVRLLGRARITGTVVALSGLHIGAGNDAIEIGGIDNPVIKHPHTGHPYIPGSSIKGKLRFLMEWAFGRIREDGLPWGADDRGNREIDPDDPVLRIFGTPIKRAAWNGGPTRLMVRDAMLEQEWLEATVKEHRALTEEKTEVVIDRIAGKAHDRIGPRHTERVPSGARFDLELVFRAFDLGDEGRRDEECLNWLIAGLSLLELDALGGSGSRGYGRVRFEGLTYHGLDGDQVALDNQFRVTAFDPERAPALVRLRAA